MKLSKLNERLSKKNSIIALILVVIFIIAGIAVSVIFGKAYYSNMLAKIDNYSISSADDFHLRKDGVTLVYKYKNGTNEVDISKVIGISKYSSFKVVAVLDEDFKITPNKSSVLSVKNGERYFVVLDVLSIGGFNKNGYLIEIVNENQYDDDYVPPHLT